MTQEDLPELRALILANSETVMKEIDPAAKAIEIEDIEARVAALEAAAQNQRG